MLRKYSVGNAGRCKKQASKQKHSKKRRFYGNQHCRDHKKEVPISHKKINKVKKLPVKKKIEGFRPIDMIIFNEFIFSLACPECLECSLFINENYAKKKGLASLISVNCSNCDFSLEKYTSQNITNDQVQGMKPFEINYRAVYALRTIGVSYSGLEKVCGMFNLLKPMTQKNYDAVSRILGNSAKMAAELSMMEVAEDLRKVPGITDIGVSVDGTWQHRGYSSLNGAVAIISMDNGKIVDVEAMTRFCKPCQQKQKHYLKMDSVIGTISTKIRV